MHLLRAEFAKVRSTRLWMGLALGGLALTGVGAALLMAIAGTEQGINAGLPAVRTAEDVRTVIFSASGALAFVLVLAATIATTEFRYGTIAGTYLATPSRARVVTAKTIAAAPIGFLFGLAAATLAVLIVAGWFLVHRESVPFGAPVVLAMGQVSLQCAYGGVLAVAVGMLVRSQLLAILGVLGWLFVIEPLATSFLPELAKWAPIAGTRALIGGDEQSGVTVFGPLGALALAAGYIAMFWVSAVWLERRRDA
jgi:ABC-type transport system involved in multi-copper enzyme maturation permease subunit